jgi:hypothetical protein
MLIQSLNKIAITIILTITLYMFMLYVIREIKGDEWEWID